MTRLIGDLLDVVSIEVGKFTVVADQNPEDTEAILDTLTVTLGSATVNHADGEGTITFSDGGAPRTVRARTLDGSAIGEGEEVCIERLEENVAFVELWAIVEQRL